LGIDERAGFRPVPLADPQALKHKINVMIKYRATLVQRVFPMLTGSVLATAIVGGAILASGSDVTPADFKQGLAFLAVVTLTSVFIQPDYGITVTPESAVINGGRKRVIDWRDIADISVENSYGYRTVVIKEFSGQSFRLLAPSSFFLDQNFEDKVNAIRAHWQERCSKIAL
jgi:hypothetical protein